MGALGHAQAPPIPCAACLLVALESITAGRTALLAAFILSSLFSSSSVFVLLNFRIARRAALLPLWSLWSLLFEARERRDSRRDSRGFECSNCVFSRRFWTVATTAATAVVVVVGGGSSVLEKTDFATGDMCAVVVVVVVVVF